MKGWEERGVARGAGGLPKNLDAGTKKTAKKMRGLEEEATPELHSREALYRETSVRGPKISGEERRW